MEIVAFGEQSGRSKRLGECIHSVQIRSKAVRSFWVDAATTKSSTCTNGLPVPTRLHGQTSAHVLQWGYRRRQIDAVADGCAGVWAVDTRERLLESKRVGCRGGILGVLKR